MGQPFKRQGPQLSKGCEANGRLEEGPRAGTLSIIRRQTINGWARPRTPGGTNARKGILGKEPQQGLFQPVPGQV